VSDRARILVVHHTPSPALQELLDAVMSGIAEVEGVEAIVRPALVASPVEVLESDGYVLGTPANIGYMSGALKHFFDQAFYVCQDATVGRPFGAYVHGGSDTTGAIRAIDAITGGMKWKPVRPAVSIVGTVTAADREACWELGGLVAATVAGLV
jgi:hypothetical protein